MLDFFVREMRNDVHAAFFETQCSRKNIHMRTWALISVKHWGPA